MPIPQRRVSRADKQPAVAWSPAMDSGGQDDYDYAGAGTGNAGGPVVPPQRHQVPQYQPSQQRQRTQPQVRLRVQSTALEPERPPRASRSRQRGSVMAEPDEYPRAQSPVQDQPPQPRGTRSRQREGVMGDLGDSIRVQSPVQEEESPAPRPSNSRRHQGVMTGLTGTVVVGEDGSQIPLKETSSNPDGDPVEMEYSRRMADYMERKVMNFYSSISY